MTLQRKVLLAVAAAYVLTLAVLVLVTQTIVLGSFARLEQERVTRNLDRVPNAIEDDVTAIRSTVGQWGAWTDTWQFVQDANPAYVERNLADSAFVNLRLNFIVYLALDKRVVMAKFVDLAEGKTVATSEALIGLITADPALMTHRDTKDVKRGIVLAPEGPALVAVGPICKNEYVGPVQGTLIMGRYLTEDEIEKLAKRVQASVTIMRLDAGALSDDIARVHARLAQEPVVVETPNSKTIVGFSELKGLNGAPCLLVRVEQPQDIYQHGVATVRIFLVLVAGLGIGVLVLLFVLLERAVLNPISRLTAQAVGIGDSGDLSRRVNLTSADEMGALGRAFDRMVEHLAEARQRLLEQSYYSGVAEMASTVLHNVRNALNPITESTDELRRRLTEVPLEPMQKAAGELRTSTPAEGRTGALVQYLCLASDRTKEMVTGARDDLSQIEQGLSEVESLLAEQESRAQAVRTVETLSLQDLIDEALRMVPAPVRGGVRIDIDPAVAAAPRVMAERVTLAQVFAAVVRNACEAVHEAGGAAEKQVCIAAQAEDAPDGRAMVHVRIRDSGQGIDDAGLKRLFARDFSTKLGGRSEIGLHWCANTVTAMGGRMHAESAGVGKGATLHVLIPAVE